MRFLIEKIVNDDVGEEIHCLQYVSFIGPLNFNFGQVVKIQPEKTHEVKENPAIHNTAVLLHQVKIASYIYLPKVCVCLISKNVPKVCCLKLSFFSQAEIKKRRRTLFLFEHFIQKGWTTTVNAYYLQQPIHWGLLRQAGERQSANCHCPKLRPPSGAGHIDACLLECASLVWMFYYYGCH